MRASDYDPRIIDEPPPPMCTVMLTEQLNKGIAAQLRALADLLDPPVRPADG